MYKLVLSFVLWLSLLSNIFGQQIKIDTKNHVANVGKGFCGYCCIETIGKHLGYLQVNNLVAETYDLKGAKGGALFDHELYALLKQHVIHFSYKDRKSYCYDVLEEACNKGNPCIVHIERITDNEVFSHYVVLVGIDKDLVYVVDSNAAGTVQQYSRNVFGKLWTGGVVIIYPK